MMNGLVESLVWWQWGITAFTICALIGATAWTTFALVGLWVHMHTATMLVDIEEEGDWYDLD